jgi:formylglycine-generating enzyme required for sulfatase activity
MDDAQIENIGIGIDGDGGLDTDDDGSIDNADFPTGYNAFYSMKYEISQGQYLEFLNTLTRTQQQTRTFTDVSTDNITNVYVMRDAAAAGDRQGIRAPATGNGTTDPITFGSDLNGNGTFNESNDGEWIACNLLSWADGAAYGDWAGMRPMTELEFEKISRGPSAAVYGEYAWGNTSIASSVYTLSSSQQAGEVIATNYASDPTGNASRTTTDGGKNGPLRVGIFATASSTRAEAGASYYGVMELSGNLREREVTVGNTNGRSFTGSHGDGSLAASGNANTSGWPGTSASGTGNRGGHWNASAEGLRVSNRGAAANQYAGRHSTYGFRLVRTE